MAKDKLVGTVTHYYDKIGVAVVKLSAAVKEGDTLKFVHGDKEFAQTVESMQLEHEQIKSAKKGQEIAIKVDKEVKSGTKVFAA